MIPEHFNWIAGEWKPAASELYFECSAVRDAKTPAERWPRSSASDFDAASEACAYAAARWSSRGRDERRALLMRVADELERRTQDVVSLAQALGLREDEFAPRHADELYRLREALELLAAGRDAQGVGFFQAHWSDLAGGLLLRAASGLVAGQTLVVLADAHLPLAGELIASACEAAGLPRGVIALLHDDTDSVLNAAAHSAGLAWLRFKGHERRLDTLRERFASRQAPNWTSWPVRARSQVVLEHAHVEHEVALAVEQSIGRAATLSAQFPGQTARVLCHQRLFSRFSEELLARLESSPDAQHPLPAIEADLDEHVRGAWELGLDEGATPLCGWEAPASRNGRQRSTADSLAQEPAPDQSRPRRGWPVVFTNVDARSRLAALTRPAPVLSLIRVPSDEVARELARRLD